MWRRKPKQATTEAEMEPDTFIKRFYVTSGDNVVGHGSTWEDGFTEILLSSTATREFPPIRAKSFRHALEAAAEHYPDLKAPRLCACKEGSWPKSLQ